METYLLTVKEIDEDSQGLRLSPGIPLDETKGRPEIGAMMQGANLELRRPNGTRSNTTLVTYGVSAWHGDDGELYMQGDLSNAEIKLTLPADLSRDEIPVGTEVWLLA
jgi:hypothetical protein